MTKQIPNNIIDILKAATVNGHHLTLAGQLSRKDYTDTMKVLDLLGGKWSRTNKCHIFDGDCAERIDEAVMTGEVVDSKKLYQFFETPALIASRMVSQLEWRPGLSVLEPSSGSGGLIDAVLRLGLAPMSLHFCELDSARAHALVARFNPELLLGLDFIELALSQKFDRIVMNPPFRGGQDIRHVRKAYDHLNAGGQMVAITSPAWTYRKGAHEDFADWFEDIVCGEVEELPPNAFAESGTNVRILMLVIKK